MVFAGALFTGECFAAGGITTPQNTYSVANTAKPFKLNAKAPSRLTYKSKNPAVAKVSKKGVVTVKKTGKTKIVITEEKTGRTKTVNVVVSKYKATNGKFAESTANKDGKKGDKNNRESHIRSYEYKPNTSYRNHCFIVRHTDPTISNKAAKAVSYIVKNKYFGYNIRSPRSQKNINARASIYFKVVKATGKNPTYKDLKKIKNIKEYADTSCTPTLMAGYWLYTDMKTKIPLKWRRPYTKKAYMYYCGATNVEMHQLEKAIKQVNKEYAKKGKLKPFEIIYIPKDKRKSFFAPKNIKKNLKRGDIICSVSKFSRNGHTMMMQ